MWLTSSLSLFHRTLSISDLFLESFPNWAVISLNPEAIRVCLSWNFFITPSSLRDISLYFP